MVATGHGRARFILSCMIFSRGATRARSCSVSLIAWSRGWDLARAKPCSPSSPTPGRAEQVAQRLTDGIVLGVLDPGERLPSEPELARRFGVALITVREGLGILREAGLVETRRGREGGSFVVARRRRPPLAHHRAPPRPRPGRAQRHGRVLRRDPRRRRRARRRARVRAATASGSAGWLAAPTSAPRHPLAPTRAASSSRSPCSASRPGSCASRSGCRPSSAPSCSSASTTTGSEPRPSARRPPHRPRRARRTAPAEAREAAGDLVRGLSVPLLAAKARSNGEVRSMSRSAPDVAAAVGAVFARRLRPARRSGAPRSSSSSTARPKCARSARRPRRRARAPPPHRARTAARRRRLHRRRRDRARPRRALRVVARPARREPRARLDDRAHPARPHRLAATPSTSATSARSSGTASPRPRGMRTSPGPTSTTSARATTS